MYSLHGQCMNSLDVAMLEFKTILMKSGGVGREIKNDIHTVTY